MTGIKLLFSSGCLKPKSGFIFVARALFSAMLTASCPLFCENASAGTDRVCLPFVVIKTKAVSKQKPELLWGEGRRRQVGGLRGVRGLENRVSLHPQREDV